MERPIHVLFAAPRERYGDLLARLQQRYAVHTARDDRAAVEYADQARSAGRPYDLAVIAYDPPALGDPAAIRRLRVIAPAMPMLALMPPARSAPGEWGLEPGQILSEPVDPDAALARAGDLLAVRAVQTAGRRAELVAPLAALSDEVLRAPDLQGALRALYRQLAGLLRAEYLFVALYDRRRGRVLVPLTWDRSGYRTVQPRLLAPGAGLSDWVLSNEAPLITGDLPAEAARRGWPAGEPGSPQTPTSALIVPLRLSGRVVGVLGALSGARNAFTPADEQTLSFVGDFMAGVVGHWWGLRQWEHEHQVLDALDQHLSQAPDRAAVLAETAEAALQLTGMSAATVIQLDPDGRPEAPILVPPGSGFAAFTPALAELAQQLAAARARGAVDYTATTRTLSDLGERGLGRVISYPVGAPQAPDALLWLLDPGEHLFDSQDQAALAAVARLSRGALAEQAQEGRRTREQQVFGRLAWRASVENSLPLLLSTALNEIRKIASWSAAALWLADPALGQLRLLRVEGTLTALPAQALPLAGSALAPALTQGGVYHLDPDPAGAPAMQTSGPAVAVSLQRSHAQMMGVLVLERALGAPAFTSREEHQLQSLAQLIVAGIERLRWQGLGGLHRALGQALSYPVPAVWARVAGVVATQLGDDIAAAVVIGGAEPEPLAVGGAATALSLHPWTDVAPLVRTVAPPGAAGRVFSGPAIAPLGSLAVVPLTVGAAVPGRLVAWTSRLAAFGAVELELLSQAAPRVAPLVLLDQTGPGEVTQQRAVSLIQTLQHDAQGAPDAGALLRLVLMHALASTPATYGAIYLREAGDAVVLRDEYPARPGRAVPREVRDLAAQVTRSGQLSHQVTADRRTGIVCVPLRDGPSAIGALLAVSPHAEAFSLEDLDLLTQLADLAAEFIRERQGVDAERKIRRASDLEVPAGRILARLPVLVCQALNVAVCLVHVLDRRRDQFRLAGSAGAPTAPAELAALNLSAEDPALAQLFAAGRPVGAATPGASLWAPDRLRGLGLYFGAAQPFLVDGRPVGLLSIHTLDNRPLESGVVQALGALAIELGAVLGALQQDRRLAVLSAGSAALPQLPAGFAGPPAVPWPIPALDGVLQGLIDQMAKLTDAGGAYLLLCTEAGRLATRLTSGLGAPEPLPPGVEHWLRLREPRYVFDVRAVAGTPTLDAAARSSLVLPLRMRGARGGPSLGLLVLESMTPHAFTPADQRALRAQAALITSLLFQHALATQQITEDRRVHELMTALPTLMNTDDENRLYQLLVNQARETLDADLVVLFPAGGTADAVPPQSGNQQAGAVAGSPAVQQMVQRVIGLAAEHPEPYYVSDIAAHPEGDPGGWMRAEGIQAMAFAPLMARDAPAGALFAGWRRPLLLDPARRQAVRLVADLTANVLQATRDQVRRRAAMKGQMQSLSMAAHEMREPLDKVHMIIETALNGLWLPMSEELRSRLSTAYTVLDTEYDLINRVLQLEHLRSGQQKMVKAPTSVGDLVKQVVSRYADQARQHKVQLDMAMDPLLAPQQALLDPVLIQLALGNLVQNGIKFTAAGGRVTVAASLSYQGKEDRQLVFTVDDTGVGIAPEEREAIFEPYYQIDRRLGREVNGLGLGLPIARLVADLHKGTLTMESEPGRGSRFILRVPFVPDRRRERGRAPGAGDGEGASGPADQRPAGAASASRGTRDRNPIVGGARDGGEES